MPMLSDHEVQLLNSGVPILSSVEKRGLGRLFYRECGPKNGTSVLFLHGIGSSSIGWRAIMAGLPSDLHLIAWDAPGFGGSSPLSRHPDGKAYAATAVQLLRALAIDQVHVVGSSWGAVLGICMAAYFPKKVKTLTLLAPNLCFGALSDDVREAVRAQFLDPTFIVQAAKASFTAKLIAADSDPLVRDLTFALKDQLTDLGYRHAVEMMCAFNTLPLAAKVKAPTVILGGDKDLLAPFDVHAVPLAAAIPQCRLICVEGAAHLLKLEAPEQVLAAVGENIGSLATTRDDLGADNADRGRGS